MVDPQISEGRTLHEWAVPEFVQYERTRRWYVTAVIVLSLFLLYAIWQENFLFGLIIVLLAVIFVLQSRRAPLQLPFAILENGILFHKKFHPYENLEAFWIIYQPPDVKLLGFRFKGIRPELLISLQGQNPLTIRETLLTYCEEDLDKERENPSNELTRLLKL